MVNKPQKREPSPDLQRRQDTLESDMATMKWVVGFGFGLLLIVISTLSGLIGIALWWTNSISTQLFELLVQLYANGILSPNP